MAEEKLHAEMVANVWKIAKNVGEDVAKDEAVVILESMKMEIPVVSEIAGKVREISVEEGQVVQEGDLIAIIDG